MPKSAYYLRKPALKKNYEHFHNVLRQIFKILIFLTLFVKIVTVSSSFFGHSILVLITISRCRLCMILAWAPKFMRNRPLLIVISLKIECPKNDDETVTILAKKASKNED